MDRPSRRAFLAMSAGALAAACRVARAAPCAPEAAAPRNDQRPFIAFLDDREGLQGARLEEFRARLAARDLGEDRLRFESFVVDARDAAAALCTIQSAVRRRPLALAAASDAVALAALPAAGSVPLLFATRSDPVAAGLVDALGRRHANATGFTYDTPVSIDRKCLELVAEAFPRTRRVLAVADAAWLAHPRRAEDLRLASARFGFAIEPVVPPHPWDVAVALQHIAPRAGDACYLPRTDILLQGIGPVMAFLQRHRLPHLFGEDRMLRSGALMAYGPPRQAHWEALATAARQLFDGADARALPVQRPREFVLAVNVAQFQRMGLELPRRIVRRADVLV